VSPFTAKFSGTHSSSLITGIIALAHSSHLSHFFSLPSPRTSHLIHWMLGMKWLRCIPATSTFDVGRLSAPFSVAGRFALGRYSLGGGHHRNDIRLLIAIIAIDSAPGYLSFVNGYTVFLAPITGIIITDVCPPLYLRFLSTART
jgi:hypothetical protein